MSTLRSDLERSSLKMSGRIALALAALAISGGPAAAAPVLSSVFTTDAAFISYLGGIGVTLPADELFVAQVRSGNNATNGDYELGLHIPPNFTNAGPIGTAGQFNWGASGGGNAWVPFSLARVGNDVTFSAGGYSETYTDPDNANLSALGIRVRSEPFNSSTRIRHLTVDGTALTTASLNAVDGGIEIMVVDNLIGNFTLAGETTLNWGGSFPQGSRLGFQIKGLDTPPIPEPGTVVLMVAGLGLIGATKLRGKRNAT